MLSTDSEKVELRRCRRGWEFSVYVEARPEALFLMGDRLCLAVLLAMALMPPFNGLIV